MSGKVSCPLCYIVVVDWPARAAHLRDDHGWIGGVTRTLNEIDYSLGRRVTQDASTNALAYHRTLEAERARP